MSSIGALASSFLQSVLGGASVGQSTANSAIANGSIGGISSTALPSDNGQISSFGQLIGTLQQLQQSNPAQYQQVTQQIAANLQSASQSAQAAGNTTAASQLSQLSTDFTSASQSGQLPNLQDLAKAAGGHHGHHHHHAPAASDSGSNSSTTSASTSSTSTDALSQLLASLEPGGSQSSSYDPTTIIQDTLENAGIAISS